MADSGYPKKGEVIHASDVGETFVKVETTAVIDPPRVLYIAELVRRDDTKVTAITYVSGSLDNTTESDFVDVGTAKSSLQTLANEHHTHTSSNFTELSGWSITESPDKSLVFSVG